MDLEKVIEKKRIWNKEFCFVFREPLWKVSGDPLSPFNIFNVELNQLELIPLSDSESCISIANN